MAIKHRWRDTILALVAGAALSLASVAAVGVQAIAVVTVVTIVIGIGSRGYGYFKEDLELGVLKRTASKQHYVQLALRLGFLGAWLLSIWSTYELLAVFGTEEQRALLWIIIAVSVLWTGLALLPRKTIPIATNVGFAVLALLIVVDWGLGHRGEAGEIEIDMPTKQALIVIQGGNRLLDNHHLPHASQSDALDLLPVENPTKALGIPLLAPVDGTVVSVQNGIEDDGKEIKKPTGNHVVIRFGDARHVLLAHLQKDSIEVAVGDEVVRGQRIAAIGNSGNSTMAHLHLQIQTKPELSDAGNSTVPMIFAGNGARNIRRGVRLTPAPR